MKYNMRASECEKKIFLLCANVRASIKIYHNSPEKKLVRALTSGGSYLVQKFLVKKCPAAQRWVACSLGIACWSQSPIFLENFLLF